MYRRKKFSRRPFRRFKKRTRFSRVSTGYSTRYERSNLVVSGKAFVPKTYAAVPTQVFVHAAAAQVSMNASGTSQQVTGVITSMDRATLGQIAPYNTGLYTQYNTSKFMILSSTRSYTFTNLQVYPVFIDMYIWMYRNTCNYSVNELWLAGSSDSFGSGIFADSQLQTRLGMSPFDSPRLKTFCKCKRVFRFCLPAGGSIIKSVKHRYNKVLLPELFAGNSVDSYVGGWTTGMMFVCKGGVGNKQAGAAPPISADNVAVDVGMSERITYKAVFQNTATMNYDGTAFIAPTSTGATTSFLTGYAGSIGPANTST